jgi:hypothetical protein
MTKKQVKSEAHLAIVFHPTMDKGTGGNIMYVSCASLRF